MSAADLRDELALWRACTVAALAGVVVLAGLHRPPAPVIRVEMPELRLRGTLVGIGYQDALAARAASATKTNSGRLAKVTQ